MDDQVRGPSQDFKIASDKAPDYRIWAGAIEFGAAWKKTARDSEREYLSVKLDDLSFPAPIHADGRRHTVHDHHVRRASGPDDVESRYMGELPSKP